MSTTKDGLLNLLGDEEAQEFKKRMESDGNNLFAALEPQSRKIEAFLNDVEDEIANGSIKDANLAKGYLTGLMSRYNLYLTESEQKSWLNKLTGIHVEDYPTLLNPEHLDDSGLWPKASDMIPKGGFKRGEMVVLMGGGPMGQSYAERLTAITRQPDFMVNSELEVTDFKKHQGRILADGVAHNDFIIRNYDKVPELEAFDSKDRNRVVHSERKALTPSQRNKRKSKNKAASVARRKSRK